MSADDEKPAKPSMAKLKTGAFQRDLALTRLGVGAGSQMAVHTLKNVFRSGKARESANRVFYERQARVLADELGQLKGGVMKAGQMLSLYGKYFLPPEAVAVLSELQDSTQPVDWAVMQPVLERNIGARRVAELEVDLNPIGAASLGQVHRARRKSDGLELAVKIQYPGVAAAIDSDVRTLWNVVLFTRVAPKGLSLAPVFDEVREMLHREVDYLAERRFTEDYGRRLADDPRFVVPRVLDAYSGEQVLTTSFEAGVS
ncbi:MAG: AarF/UbiB family protein, partial [Sinobacteraceae bacterium]|nr:AarF/UbiB family protein [Nevskiaceae bacterium]